MSTVFPVKPSRGRWSSKESLKVMAAPDVGGNVQDAAESGGQAFSRSEELRRASVALSLFQAAPAVNGAFPAFLVPRVAAHPVHVVQHVRIAAYPT